MKPWPRSWSRPAGGPGELAPGVVARWWALFRDSGPEIEYFRRFVEEGQPALDVACGTAASSCRTSRTGWTSTGSTSRPTWSTLCREAAAAAGAAPTLYCQAMHDLDLPRRYRTIYVCGGLGLGSTREQDEEALRRLHDHLEPGGRLVLDNEVPYSGASTWSHWPPGTREDLPQPEQPPTDRRRAPDGDEYALRTRLLALDPLGQQEVHEIHALQWRDGALVAEERHRLTVNLYFRGELVMMLERAGFSDVQVRGEYNDLEPTPDDHFLVYVATRA